jgi:hypothetical protein
VIASCVIVALSGCGHGDPDPGGRILDALKTVQAAVPSDATDVSTQYAEPHWDSCDGRPGTEGWSDVTVDVSFSSDRPGQELVGGAAPELAAAAWSVERADTSPLGPYESWTRTLDDGTILHASLGPGTPDNGATIIWYLYASAPPHGRRASGC